MSVNGSELCCSSSWCLRDSQLAKLPFISTEIKTCTFIFSSYNMPKACIFIVNISIDSNSIRTTVKPQILKGA